MKRFALLLLFVAGCATMGSIAEVDIDKEFPHNEIQKVVVLKFEATRQDEEEEDKSVFSRSFETADAGNVLANIVVRELGKWGKYIVLDRRAFKEGLKLVGISEEDILHKENYLEMVKALGIDAVVAGEVEEFGVSYRKFVRTLIDPVTVRVSFQVRCIDITSGESIWNFNIKGESKYDNERVLATKLVEEAVDKLKLEIK